MTKRPLSVSIIGWWLIATGAIGIIGLALTPNNPTALRLYAHSPLPLWAHIAIGAVGTLITIVSGYGMLKGHNWSRFLYAGWSVIGFAITLLTIPATSLLLIGLVFFAVILFFLFRPDATAGFRSGGAAADA